MLEEERSTVRYVSVFLYVFVRMCHACFTIVEFPHLVETLVAAHTNVLFDHIWKTYVPSILSVETRMPFSLNFDGTLSNGIAVHCCDTVLVTWVYQKFSRPQKILHTTTKKIFFSFKLSF